MAKYEVWIKFSGCAVYYVDASSEEMARAIAMDEADSFDCDVWDIDVDDVEIEEDDD